MKLKKLFCIALLAGMFCGSEALAWTCPLGGNNCDNRYFMIREVTGGGQPQYSGRIYLVKKNPGGFNGQFDGDVVSPSHVNIPPVAPPEPIDKCAQAGRIVSFHVSASSGSPLYGMTQGCIYNKVIY